MKSRPAVVFLHPSDELYGADRMLLEMVDAACEIIAGDRVEVWLPTDLEHPDPDRSLCCALEGRGVVVRHLDLPVLRRDYRTPLGLLALLLRTVGLVRELRAARPDLVYCGSSATLLGAPAARVAGAGRVVAHLQEVWTRGDRVALTALSLCCDLLVCISRAVVEPLPRVVRGLTRIVPNGTPEPAGTTSLEGRTGPLRFVVASRWNGWKGHRTLLKAWDVAQVDGVLLVLGGPPRSGERVDVPSLVDDLQRPGSVQVVGEVPDASVWVEQADVMVVPSDRPEPFGLVAIEAFARGRPVVASAAGGLLDVVTPGQDGWTYPLGDVQALAGLLAGLDRPTVTAAGRAARATYENRFTSARFRDAWRALVLPIDPR